MNVKNPYVSVEISEDQFSDIRESLRKELENLGFDNLQELHNPHISIAYILGEKNIQDLDSLAQEISEGPFLMHVNGIKIMQSVVYQGSVVCLSLQHTDDFIYLQEYVKESVVTDDSILIKEDFPGGFQAHISLFVIKDLDEETIDVLPKYLEIALASIKASIRGEKFTIYNSDREKLIEKLFLS